MCGSPLPRAVLVLAAAVAVLATPSAAVSVPIRPVIPSSARSTLMYTSNGVLHISYSEFNISQSSGSLILRACDTTDCAAARTVRAVYGPPGVVQGEYVSLAALPSGNITLAFSSECVNASTGTSSSSLGILVCNSSAEQCASTPVLFVNGSSVGHGTPTVGWFADVTANAHGNPAVAHYDPFHGRLIITQCQDSWCSHAFSTQIKTGGGDVGQYARIVLGADNLLAGAAFDLTASSLTFFHCNDFACNSVDARHIDGGASVAGKHIDMLVFGARLFITYLDETIASTRGIVCEEPSCDNYTPPVTILPDTSSFTAVVSIAGNMQNGSQVREFVVMSAQSDTQSIVGTMCTTPPCAKGTKAIAVPFSGPASLAAATSFNNTVAVTFYDSQFSSLALLLFDPTEQTPSSSGDSNGSKVSTTGALLLSAASLLIAALVAIVWRRRRSRLKPFKRWSERRQNSEYIRFGSSDTETELSAHPTVTTSRIRVPEGMIEIPYHELRFGPVIGGGATGDVFSALWNGTEVAVKRLHAYMLIQDATVRQVENEMRILARLRHPNVVLCLGVSLTERDVCIVLEYLVRDSTSALLYSGALDGVQGMRRRLSILADVARGMAYLHAFTPSVIHRDLKPQNMLVGDDWNCKVADFGFSAQQLEDRTRTEIGTPAYSAPEVLTHAVYTEKADVYSFGVSLWEVLSGKRPFAGYCDIAIVRSVSEKHERPPLEDLDSSVLSERTLARLRDLISLCWQQDPRRRPPFSDILVRLESVASAAEASGEL